MSLRKYLFINSYITESLRLKDVVKEEICQNCTKTKLKFYESTKLYKDTFEQNKFAQGYKTARRQICTKVQFCLSYNFARE